MQFLSLFWVNRCDLVSRLVWCNTEEGRHFGGYVTISAILIFFTFLKLLFLKNCNISVKATMKTLCLIFLEFFSGQV